MAHNPQAPYGQGAQGPEGYDPAGSTQMFRAFVDEGPQHQPQQAAAVPAGGPRLGVIAGVIAAIVVVAAVVWLAVF
ncbi:hypothetical protein HHL19_32530 [Streptomyces sp. R302]|uniref:hypothetical protein n=1 Tax=unclassified Streptomyces TaxID=2593676 RepID=UPI00145EC0A3|nr:MULTISPECIES: hypothetical protein [unclassified Streptomyces]NML53985.1 hypothetical protein [Streptomyces sp. R301]NML83245.1 hypothetical protein [Streptomyces sp. R302]